jgi:tetrapyrrole methylase family protein/MazG family protein
VTVVGLGPAGPDHLSIATRTVLATAVRGYLRTRRHPAAVVLAGVDSFDQHYEQAADFDEVYTRIVEDLVAAAEEAAESGGAVVYGVPGSPLVAERTVDLLRNDSRVRVQVIPALSFLDLAWDRLGIDPLATSVRLVDGTQFAVEGAMERAPMLVAQCWSRAVLSDIKLSVDSSRVDDTTMVTLLHHLGLEDEKIETVPWWDMDRSLEPDHLTSLWIPALGAPGGGAGRPAPAEGEVGRLADLVRTLRERCPWDREQTHASLVPHLLEEAYETIDALEALSSTGTGNGAAGPAAAHLKEELGDLLVQILFHTTLATEEGLFGLDDVARGVHDKLVARHPHVFGDTTLDSAAAVEDHWEAHKRAEKGRDSVTEGIPSALPALALAAKLQRKAQAVGLTLPDFSHGRDWLSSAVAELDDAAAAADPGVAAPEAQRLGAMLFGLADLARRLGIDPEEALRATALGFKDRIVAAEQRTTESSGAPGI